MLADAMTVNALATLALLIGLELVLGIDNVLVISIVVSRLPAAQRDRARLIGLGLAFALAFLVTIGVTIFLEGMHQHVAKAYLYLPMGFALAVELLQMRHEANRRRLASVRGEGIEPPTNSV